MDRKCDFLDNSKKRKQDETEVKNKKNRSVTAKTFNMSGAKVVVPKTLFKIEKKNTILEEKSGVSIPHINALELWRLHHSKEESSSNTEDDMGWNKFFDFFIEEDGRLESHLSPSRSSLHEEPGQGEVNRLELELQRVQKENLKNESLHNFSEKDDFTSNGEAKPEDYVNKLEAEIQSLKKHLRNSRDRLQLALHAQIAATSERDELREQLKKKDAELIYVQEQLLSARQNVIEKIEKVEVLENLEYDFEVEDDFKLSSSDYQKIDAIYNAHTTQSSDVKTDLSHSTDKQIELLGIIRDEVEFIKVSLNSVKIKSIDEDTAIQFISQMCHIRESLEKCTTTLSEISKT